MKPASGPAGATVPVLACLLLVGFVAPLSAADRPLVAVLPFEAIGIPQGGATVATTIEGFIETALAETEVYAVMSRIERDRVLEGEGATPGACRDEPCAVAAGRALGAAQVLQGSAAQLEGRYIINAKLIDVAASHVLAADSTSAAGPEELELACRQLTWNLATKVFPQLSPGAPEPLQAAAAEEAQEGGAAVPTGPGAAESGAAPAEEPAPAEAAASGTQSAGEEAPAGPAGARTVSRSPGPRFLPYLTISGGVLLGLAGNVAGSVAFETRRGSDAAGQEYLEATGNFDELWSSYQGLYGSYLFSTVFAYSSWALSVSLLPVYLFLFPADALELSPWGKVAYASGLAMMAAGSVLDMVACGQRYTNDFLYEDYLSAGDAASIEALYQRYTDGYTLYAAERVSSFALWGLGALGMAGAFFVPGEREHAVTGLWEQLLTLAGGALTAAGSLMRTLALNARQDFANTDGSDEALYRGFLLYSGLAYALWGAGAAAGLLPLLFRLPDRGGSPETGEVRPELLQLLPAPGGFVVRVSLASQ
jgi:TolB-like protein